MEVAMVEDAPGPWMRPPALPPSQKTRHSWGSDSGTQAGSPALPVSIRLEETPRDVTSPRGGVVSPRDAVAPPQESIEEKEELESLGRALWGKARRQVMGAVKVSRGFRTLRDMCADYYVDPSDLKTVENLGEGAFAVVDKAVMTVPGGESRVVAVKRLKKEVLKESSNLEEFVKEYNLLKKLRNSNIVEVLGVGSMDTATEDKMKDTTFIVEEYIDGGSLKDIIYQQMRATKGNIYSKADAFRWFAQIAEGLAYMHTAVPTVIHRDLKLENILLKGSDASDMQAKVVDFGLAALAPAPSKPQRAKSSVFKRSGSLAMSRRNFMRAHTSTDLDEMAVKAYDLSTRIGSFLYMAPEVFLGGKYNEKVDVFSFGIIMYEVLRARITLAYLPISDGPGVITEYAQRVANGFRPPLPNHWPQCWQDLISACWAGHTEERPTMAQVVERINGIIEKGVEEVNSDIVRTCCCSIQ